MTGESLKPFISLPISAYNFSSKKKSVHNLIRNGLCALFIIISIGFSVWNSMKVFELQNEVNSLNKIIENMQKRLHYLDDLNEMDGVLENVLVKDPSSYKAANDDGDDVDYGDDDVFDDNNHDDDDDDTEQETIPAILEDYDDDDIADGSGLYEEDKDIKDSAYDSDFEDISVQAKNKRITRSISTQSNGIPIYEDLYARKRNRTGGPDDDRSEQNLLNKNSSTTLRNNWSDKSPKTISTETEIVIEKRKKSAPSNIRFLNSSRQKFHRQLKTHRLLRPFLKSGRSDSMTAVPNPHLIAVHYHLNNTISGKHVLHPSHHKLPHDGDVYIGSPHPWARTLGMDKVFDLNRGVLTVKEGGLYFVYAQIYYDNRFDRNGFVIYHNIQPFLQCALFVPTNTVKSHTCYTSGVIYLDGSDQLHLRDIHQDRVVMLTNAKSFFGLIKLGEI